MIHENYEISPSSDDSRVRVRSLQGDRCAPLCAQYPCDGAKRYCSNRHSSCVCDGRWRSSPTVAVERPVATTGRPLRALVRAVMSLDENNNKLTDRSRPKHTKRPVSCKRGFVCCRRAPVMCLTPRCGQWHATLLQCTPLPDASPKWFRATPRRGGRPHSRSRPVPTVGGGVCRAARARAAKILRRIGVHTAQNR